MWLYVLSSVDRKLTAQLAFYPCLRLWEIWDGAADTSAVSDTQSCKIIIKYGKRADFWFGTGVFRKGPCGEGLVPATESS